MDTFYIDVREIDEFEQQHIEGSFNTPLSKLESYFKAISQLAQSFKLIIVCKSGLRSGTALSKLKKVNLEIKEIEILQGGIDQWEKEGKSLVSHSEKNSLPIMRQVMTIAGFLILLGSLGGIFLKSELVWLAVFVGAGLSFAGLSGICFMAKLLAVMPWNK